MEIVKGFHRIEAPLGNRVMYQHLIIGKEKRILVDTGIRDTPGDVIFPYFESIGFKPAHVTDVVITHADADHSGGNEAIKRRAPQAKLLCHALDRAQIEDPDRMVRERYNEFAEEGVAYSAEIQQALRGMMGAPVPIDGELVQGDTLHLDENRWIEVHHVPGHSPGHLMLYDPTASIALITDSVLGNGLPDAEGTIVFPPTYRSTDAYLNTLVKIEALQPEVLLTTHYPLMRGIEVSEFVRKSREFVARMELTVTELVRQDDLTFAQLLEGVNSRMAQWPKESYLELAYALMGTLESMDQRKMVVRVPGKGLSVWTLRR